MDVNIFKRLLAKFIAIAIVFAIMYGVTIGIVSYLHRFKLSTWTDFRDDIQDKYSFINGIDIYNNNISLFVTINTDSKMELIQLYPVYKDIKGYILRDDTMKELKAEFSFKRCYIDFKTNNEESCYCEFWTLDVTKDGSKEWIYEYK